MTSPSTVDTAVRSARSMSMWRLEWLRFARTSRWIVLFGVYLVFGLLGPVMAKYLPEIVGQVQSEMTIIVPPPQPKDGIVNYVNQVAQIGLIVVVTIAANALTFDARRGLSTFLRTRVNSMWALLQPRLVVTAAFAVLAYTLGTLAAWYETTLLLGPLPAAALAAGVLCESIYLIFSIAVVAAASAFARGTLGTVGIALTVIIVLSIVGGLGVLHDWLPTTLAGAPVALLTTITLSSYLPAMVVAVGSSVALVALALIILRAREV